MSYQYRHEKVLLEFAGKSIEVCNRRIKTNLSIRQMSIRLKISAHEEIDESLITKIRAWANEVMERARLVLQPPYLCITIWKTMEELQDFYKREKEELGIHTGEEADFLATHEAWRGYPRIHVCQERLRGIPGTVVQGIVHHEISHALHHGTPEFYTFRFSTRLQETGRSYGLDLSLLQQCVYLLSVAIKDQEVVQWLAEIGLGFSQRALLAHLISDTNEERWVWQQVRTSPALRRVCLAAFLKTFLPIEVMIAAGIEEAQGLRNQWSEAYGWLSEEEREGLFRLTKNTMNQESKTFQERLEEATLRLITEPSI